MARFGPAINRRRSGAANSDGNLLGFGKRKSLGGFRMKYSSVPRPHPLPGESLGATGGGSSF